MADGIDVDSLAMGIERLCGEAFLAPEEPLYATSSMLRAVVVQSMPAPRTSEVYRFIAGAMEAAAAKNAEFEKATIGYYLAEGGQEAEGARCLIEAGRAAALGGFPRAAVRLAAAAVQYDPSPRTRSAATTLSRSVSARRRISAPPLPETVIAIAEQLDDGSPETTEGIVHSVVASLRDRDFDSVDRILDIAIAEGHDRAAAERLRALTELGRGELEAALVSLHNSREALSTDPSAIARTELARAIILLGARHPARALRSALAALRLSRGAQTPSGESASLKMLSLCYLALGRTEEARQLARA
jgi:tetratricopeptide (TPR) repeat protein